ncbi:hypothetical protein [Blastopirellula retiformator]|uniref:Uncharacterized protein n=1 Tax=Blastopirellula retiformator TaxID=2527970 RepID=A0A5C5VMH2_9BACT|nr:hypothetical protein [Blastopirellula retiformator]TWT39091.1 hypothetical protein Enr8_07860 [Blastopirellula retiformator]
MIWESRYWKDDLLRKAEDLRKRRSQRRWPESSLARLEQSLMLGFYGVRKLHEAAKLSTNTMSRSVALVVYPWLGRNVTKLNWHNLERLYDFESGNVEDHDLLFLCHQFVHSFVFMAAFDENHRLDGILLASDRQRHKALLQVPIELIANLFQMVGEDHTVESNWCLNSKGNDFDIVSV